MTHPKDVVNLTDFIIPLRLSYHFLLFVCLFLCIWRDTPQCARTSSYVRFLDHTQRRTTVGRTPLDE